MKNNEMKKFIKCALNRAIRTIAQAAIASIGAASIVSQVDWVYTVSASLLAGLLSILTSVATGLPEADSGGGKNE